MSPRTAAVVQVFVCVFLCSSVAFSLYLAKVAYLGSREVGAGAAQGDLGFFMILTVVSPVILLGTAFLWWLDRYAARKWELVPKPSVLVRGLSIASVLAIGWNWFYLFEFWKA